MVATDGGSSDVPAEVIFRLGLVVGVLVPLLHIIPISMIPRYKLTRNVVLDIQATLAEVRTEEVTVGAIREGSDNSYD